MKKTHFVEIAAAVKAGDIARMAALVASGAAADARGKGGVTPLYLAAREGQAAIVRLLLMGGASVDEAIEHDPEVSPVRSFLTPLKIAVERGHLDVIRALAGAGASLEHKSPGSPETPLGIAVQKSSVDVVCLLLELGASVHMKSGITNETPLMLAHGRGDSNVVAALEKAGAAAANVPAHDLVLAIEAGDEAGVSALLAGDVDVNAATDNGRLPLAAAVVSNRPLTVRALLERGARVSVSMLEASALLGRRQIFELLVAEPVVSLGSKARDRDSFAILRERAKKNGWNDVDALTKPHRERLGLVRPKG